MTFGLFLCVDAFLYVFTLLPLRVLLAVLRLLTLPCCGFRSETMFSALMYKTEQRVFKQFNTKIQSLQTLAHIQVYVLHNSG